MRPQQQLSTPGANISSDGAEARQTPGTPAGTPAASLLPDTLKMDLHNYSEGGSDSSHLLAIAS
jgi:hypothetical protein